MLSTRIRRPMCIHLEFGLRNMDALPRTMLLEAPAICFLSA